MQTYMLIKDSTDEVLGIGLIDPAVLSTPAAILEHAEQLATQRSLEEGFAVTARLVDAADLPGPGNDSYDKTFRGAFRHSGNGKVHEDLDHAKLISHERRRARRDIEMAPHDEVIMKQLPGKSAVDAEAARQAIRNKHEKLQLDIDAAGSTDALKTLLSDAGA